MHRLPYRFFDIAPRATGASVFTFRQVSSSFKLQQSPILTYSLSYPRLSAVTVSAPRFSRPNISLYAFATRFVSNKPVITDDSDADSDDLLAKRSQRMQLAKTHDVPMGIMADINHRPTIAGKAFAAASYLVQAALAALGVVAIGGICYSLYEFLLKPDAATRIQKDALVLVKDHDSVRRELGYPVTGNMGTGRGGRALISREFVRDGVPCSYVKFPVKGANRDAVIHAEKMGGEFYYIIVEVPSTGNNFSILDKRVAKK